MAIFNENGACLSVGTSNRMSNIGMSIMEYATRRNEIDEILESLTIDLAATNRAYDFLNEAGVDEEKKSNKFIEWVKGMIDKLIDGFLHIEEWLRTLLPRLTLTKEKERQIRNKWAEMVNQGGRLTKSENAKKHAKYTKALAKFNTGVDLLSAVNTGLAVLKGEFYGRETDTSEHVREALGKRMIGEAFDEKYAEHIKKYIFDYDKEVDIKSLSADDVIGLAKGVNQTIPAIKKNIMELRSLSKSLKNIEGTEARRYGVNIVITFAKDSITAIKNGISSAMVICNAVYKGKVEDADYTGSRSVYDEDDEDAEGTYIPH